MGVEVPGTCQMLGAHACQDSRDLEAPWYQLMGVAVPGTWFKSARSVCRQRHTMGLNGGEATSVRTTRLRTRPFPRQG